MRKMKKKIILNKSLTPSAQYSIRAKNENQTLQTPIFSGNWQILALAQPPYNEIEYLSL